MIKHFMKRRELRRQRVHAMMLLAYTGSVRPASVSFRYATPTDRIVAVAHWIGSMDKATPRAPRQSGQVVYLEQYRRQMRELKEHTSDRFAEVRRRISTTLSRKAH